MPNPRTPIGNALDDAKMYARFAWGLRGYLRQKITLEQARAIVRRRLEEREASFLRVVERGVYGYPRSPYLPLLKLAGCELGDLRAMVRDRGLEGTLRALREAGVYVSFEEFKGREPIVREGREFPVEARDFDNPYLQHAYHGSTSGSTGAGTRVDIDLDHIAGIAVHVALTWDAHGFLGVPSGLWRGTAPDTAGMLTMLICSPIGMLPRRWFAYLTERNLRPALKYRLATRGFIALGRAFGRPIPAPRPVPLDRAAVVAHWMARTVRTDGACLLFAPVSMALRVGVAAREEGLDLRGAAFSGGGEPPTPAKVREITACGARWIPLYGYQDIGTVGLGCGNPVDGNDVHFTRDVAALIQHPRRVPGFELTVPAFLLTGLLPTFPKILLNAESDDFGLVEPSTCGCPLEEVGYTEHIREIYSFRKLTGEGVTLVGSEMVRILEEVLPARFGGSPLDYQLLEEEDEGGLTRLSLLVSPKIQIADEGEVIDVVLEALRRSSPAADVAQAVWSQAGTFRIQRREPILTAGGKLLTLRLARRASDPSRVS